LKLLILFLLRTKPNIIETSFENQVQHHGCLQVLNLYVLTTSGWGSNEIRWWLGPLVLPNNEFYWACSYHSLSFIARGMERNFLVEPF
jgi:hypothetical protein